MKTKIFLIFGIIFLVSLSFVSAIDNFNISSSTGSLFFVNGTSGYVGIGTTGSSHKLDINAADGEAGNTYLIRAVNAEATANDNYGILLRAGSGTANTFLAQDKDSNNLFIIKGGGNVGIGTTSPSRKLDIIGGANIPVRINGSDNSMITFTNKYETTIDDIRIGAIAKDLEFFTNGTSRVSIEENGNVGIGTTTPGNNLEVFTDANGEGISIISTGDTRNRISFDADRAGAGANLAQIDFNWNGGQVARITALSGDDTTNKDEGELMFETSNSGGASEAMRIDYNGNVGIGTTSPSKLLEVASNGGDSAYFQGDIGIGIVPSVLGNVAIKSTASFDAGYVSGAGVGIHLENNATAGNGNYGSAIAWGALGVTSNQAAISSVQTTADANQVGLQFWTHDSATGSADMIEAVRIDHNGNVGIGTANPSYRLYVNSSSYGSIARFNAPSAASESYIDVVNSNGVASFGVDTSGNAYISPRSASKGIRFFTSIGKEVYIDVNGNVGIGTTSPSEKLFVAGNISSYNFNTTGYNTYAGVFAGDSNTESNVVAVGYQAGLSNTGESLTATGNFAGGSNIGNYSSLFGYKAGYSNSGNQLTATGYEAGYQNTGFESTALGFRAGYQNKGFYLTGVGLKAGWQNVGNESTFAGHQAGLSNAGNQVSGFGVQAGQSNTRGSVTAVGYRAAMSNVGSSLTATGWQAGYENTGDSSAFFGYGAGQSNIGNRSVSIGYSAGQLNTGNYLTATGYYAGRQNSGISLTAIGYQAGYQNIGNSSSMFGYYAGYQNTGNSVTLLGYAAGQSNSGLSVASVGYQAGRLNTGNYLTSLGDSAGELNSGERIVAIGYEAGYQNSGTYSSMLGYQSGYNNKGDYLTATGYQSGASSIGNYSSLYGYYAGYANKGNKIVAIGYQAGQSNTGNSSSMFGQGAGKNNVGSYSVLLGYNVGQENSNIGVVAIGSDNTAYQNTGSYSNIIGMHAGRTNTGSHLQAMGYEAGYENIGEDLIAIGHQTGYRNNGSSQVSIGYWAGSYNIGNNGVAIGREAEYFNKGDNVVALGYQAGMYNNESNVFILKQNNVNSVPLIWGNFSSGDTKFGGNVNMSSYNLTMDGGEIHSNSTCIKITGATTTLEIC